MRSAVAALCIVFASTATALTQARKEMLAAVQQMEIHLGTKAWAPPVRVVDWDQPPTSLQRHLWTDMREELYFFVPNGQSTHPVTIDPERARTSARFNWHNKRWEVVP